MDGISKSPGDLQFHLLKAGITASAPGTGNAAGDVQNPGNVLHEFGQLLHDQLNQVNDLQNSADEAAQTYATGGSIELHNVMIATEKADLAMNLTMQIRNKVISAYQEINRMTI